MTSTSNPPPTPSAPEGTEVGAPSRRGPGSGKSDGAPAGGSDEEHGLPWWLTWTTVRGAALIAAGATVLVGPREKALLVSILGVLFVGWAAAELWFVFVRGRRSSEPVSTASDPEGAGATRWNLEDSQNATSEGEASVASVLGAVPTGLGLRSPERVIMVLILVAAAALLFADHLAFSVVAGGVLVTRGLLMTLSAMRSGRDSSRSNGLLSALTAVIVGTVVILVPDTAVLALRAGLGVGSMALGGIILSMGLRHGRPGSPASAHFDHRTAPALLNDWLLRRHLEPGTRDELVETLFFEPPNQVAKLASFWVMMVLATGIATFAVIQDSTAVVIGAMLVAPLMTPIMGVSAAAVNGWPTRLIRSLLLVLVAAAAAVAIAWLIASWLPSVGDLTTNGQISSRIEPSLLDFCIAVFAGSAGAYATVDPRVSSSLSGVAIAVALVPPLSVVGITIQQGDWSSAQGATLLFLTNVVSIVLAAVTVFVLMGFAALPPDRDQRDQLRRVLSVFGVGALVILLPLSFTSEDLWNEAADEGVAHRVLDEWLPSDGSISYQDVDAEGDTMAFTLTGPAVPQNTDELIDRLSERLDYRPKLSIRLVPSSVTEVN